MGNNSTPHRPIFDLIVIKASFFVSDHDNVICCFRPLTPVPPVINGSRIIDRLISSQAGEN